MQVVRIITTVASGLSTDLFNPNSCQQERMRVTQLLQEPITVQLDQIQRQKDQLNLLATDFFQTVTHPVFKM